MDERDPGGVSVLRIALAWTALVAAVAMLLLLARALPGTPFGGVVAFAIGMVVTPILASPWEWVVHRYVYHRPVVPGLRRIYSIHLAHHRLYFPTWRYATNGPARRIPIVGGESSQVCRTRLGNALTRASHFLFYFGLGVAVILVPSWLLASNLPLLMGAIFSLAVISNLFITVHDAIHRPLSHRLLQRQPWFRFLDEHHYIHHVDVRSNVNFLLPLADLLFGTLRRTLTPAERAAHAPRARAKAHLSGQGEPASRLVSRAAAAKRQVA